MERARAAGQLALPDGADPVLADLIRAYNDPRFPEWAGRVRRIGGCAHPLHMRGYRRTIDPDTGQMVAEFSTRTAPGGVLLVPCRNRRAAVCPACAEVYRGDTYHLDVCCVVG